MSTLAGGRFRTGACALAAIVGGAMLTSQSPGVVRAAPKSVLTLPPSIAEPPSPKKPTPQETRCAPCHVVGSWSTVKFNHEKTGFPLLGAHEKVSCKGCHTKDFRQRVPD